MQCRLDHSHYIFLNFGIGVPKDFGSQDGKVFMRWDENRIMKKMNRGHRKLIWW